MSKVGSANLLFFLAISVFLTGCGGTLKHNNKSKVVQQLLEQAIANQVFVEGGTFMLGDVGRPGGTPYVTLESFSRPAVEVSIDSYSISRYETTWGK